MYNLTIARRAALIKTRLKNVRPFSIRIKFGLNNYGHRVGTKNMLSHVYKGKQATPFRGIKISIPTRYARIACTRDFASN